MVGFDYPELFSRRKLLQMSGLGLGTVALASLLKADGERSFYNDLKAREGHFPGSAKAVIQMVQNGGPSQMDLFDPKPELTKRGWPAHPRRRRDSAAATTPTSCCRVPSNSARTGRCGMELSEVAAAPRHRRR